MSILLGLREKHWNRNGTGKIDLKSIFRTNGRTYSPYFPRHSVVTREEHLANTIIHIVGLLDFSCAGFSDFTIGSTNFGSANRDQHCIEQN